MTEHNTEPTFEYQQWANRMIVYAKDASIRTVDELLAAAGVDLSIWEICGEPSLNKWSVAAKVKDSTLEYIDGRVSGSIDEHGLVIAPMFQVKVSLVRKHPVAVLPIISPVDCPVTFIKPSIREYKRTRRALVLGDLQTGFRRDMQSGRLVPMHDRRVMDLALQIAIDARVDSVFFCGDMIDFAEWSDKFLSGPEFFQTTQPALLELAWWLRRFRQSLPETTIKLKLGNHEARMRTALLKHLPAACDLKVARLDISFDDTLSVLSLPNLLALDKLGIDYDHMDPGDIEWLNDLFGLFHGDIAKTVPGATARSHLDKYGAQLAFFHIHRPEMTAATIHFTDRSLTAWAQCPGCACHIDGRVPGDKKQSRWVQGFGIVDYIADGDMASMQTVLVDDGRALYNGRVYKSQNSLRALQTDLPTWNFSE